MQFTKLKITNFRGTRELEIDFEPDVTVVVGRNGAGKTSILDAISAIAVHLYGIETSVSELVPSPSSHDVRESEISAEINLEVDSESPWSDISPANAYTIRIDKDSGILQFFDRPARDFPLPRVVYYRQERGFGSAGKAGSAASSVQILDADAVLERSLRSNLRTIGDLGEWWDKRDAQEARRVRDGERDYRDPQLEAIRNLVAKVDGFSGIGFDSTASLPGLFFRQGGRNPCSCQRAFGR